jgi:hypothetical protein
MLFEMNRLQNEEPLGQIPTRHIKNEGISREVIENKRANSSSLGISCDVHEKYTTYFPEPEKLLKRNGVGGNYELRIEN